MTTPKPTALQQARKDLQEAFEEAAKMRVRCETGWMARGQRLVDAAIDNLITEAQLAVHRTKD